MCKTAIESELALERQLRALDPQPEASQRRQPGTVTAESRPRQTQRQTTLSQASSQVSSQVSRVQGRPAADQPVRHATVAQVKVLQRVADQPQFDLRRQAEHHFGVPTIEALTIRQASWLIDHLKAIPMPVAT